MLGLGVSTAVGALLLTGCSPSSAPPPPADDTAPAEVDEDFDLDALIAAAQLEGPLTVVDVTGKITEHAEAFTEKYGIETTGVKMNSPSQAEVIIREGQAGRAVNDVFFITDTPTAVSDLLPRGFVESWFPADMADVVPAEYQTPAVITEEANVWTYNTEKYDTCPISNVWELTEPEWSGRVTIEDPLLKSDYAYWFNQMESYGDDALAEAYEEAFGEPLETDENSATAEWVKRLAQNGPIIGSADEIADSIGFPGQDDPFVGLLSTSKYRDNADGLVLGLCEDIVPWVGRSYTKTAMIATNTASPNAAKLFVHYMYTEEGIDPQLHDGKVSTNSTIAIPDDEPSGVQAVWDRVLESRSETAQDDFDRLQDWQDFWRVNFR